MTLLEFLARISTWRRTALVLATIGLALLGALGSRQVSSLPLAAIVIIAVSGGCLTALMLLFDWATHRRQVRDVHLWRLRRLGERMAIYDRETGLYAYWYINLRIQEEMARASRHEQPFVLLLVESARGQLGTEEEELLLKTMTEGFRSTDLVAHLGNLRFVTLLPNTGVDGGKEVCQRLRKEFGALEVHIGLSLYPDDGADWQSLLKAAQVSWDGSSEMAQAA